eukprot:10288522-Alexandrium_andersonii.AAC.1
MEQCMSACALRACECLRMCSDFPRGSGTTLGLNLQWPTVDEHSRAARNAKTSQGGPLARRLWPPRAL